MDAVELAPAIWAYPLAEAAAGGLLAAIAARPDEAWARSGVVGSGDPHEARTSAGLRFGDDMRAQRLQARAMIDATLRHYNARFHTGATNVESVNVLRYQPGETYRPHVDSSWQSYRVVSVLIYLNPTEYEGGETSFPLFGVDVKPASPSVVLFPSNYAYRHEARPVLAGTKYVIVSWVSDLPTGADVPVVAVRTAST